MKFEKLFFFSIVNAGDNAQKSAQGFKKRFQQNIKEDIHTTQQHFS